MTSDNNISPPDSPAFGDPNRAQKPMGQTISGVVIRAFGKRFHALADGIVYSCSVRLRVKTESAELTSVVVGDDVDFMVIGEGEGVIEKVGPRRTSFFRPHKGVSGRKQTLAANIDQLVIVVSVAEPALKPRLIDRFTVAADLGGLDPVVVINKVDLDRPEIVDELIDGYSQIGIPALVVSATEGTGMAELRDILRQSRSLFVGHSGVGKSTLLNALIPGIKLNTATVSTHTGKGRHTTIRMEIHALPDGGFLVDSPGLKVLSLWEVTPETLASHFREFKGLEGECRFSDCVHDREPDCAVKNAVSSGTIPRFRHDSYVYLRQSIRDDEESHYR